MSAVWVVRDREGCAFFVSLDPIEAGDVSESSDAVTRETLLTPAHQKVIDAAKALAGVISQPTSDNYREWRAASHGLVAAVNALRAQEGA